RRPRGDGSKQHSLRPAVHQELPRGRWLRQVFRHQPFGKALASSSTFRQRSTKPLLGSWRWIEEMSLSFSLPVRKYMTTGLESGFNPRSCNCCLTLKRWLSEEESTLPSERCGTRTLSQSSLSRAFKVSIGFSS